MSEYFPKMTRIVREGTVGIASVEHFTVSESASRMTALGGGRDFVPPGRYARLLLGEGFGRQTMMSDTPYERQTNHEIVERARGKVLVFGYGLGMILTAMLPKREVSEVVVVEKYPDVVSLVDPQIRKHVKKASSKLRVLVGDALDTSTKAILAREDKFDVIWFDIWAGMSTDELATMTALGRTYRSLLVRPGGYMNFWDRDYLRWKRDAERRGGW